LHSTFIFGAGSSRGTLGAEFAPVSSEFGQQLSAYPGEFPGIEKVAQHLGCSLSGMTLEKLWTCVDYYAKFEAILPERAPWNAEGSRDIKRALLRIYGQRCDERAEHLSLEKDFRLRKVLQEVRSGDVLISFNYDTLVERLALRMGHNPRSFHYELRSDVVNLAKPHGSTSWCLDLNARTVTSSHPDGSPLLESLAETEVARSREPLVLGAVPIKSELLREIQRFYGLDDIFSIVARQWQAVVEAIAKTERLVVVGYSFPKEDQYGRFLLKEAVRHRSTGVAVEYYEQGSSERRDDVTCSIWQTFSGKISSLEYKGEVDLA
jgi:hypothetical protein